MPQVVENRAALHSVDVAELKDRRCAIASSRPSSPLRENAQGNGSAVDAQFDRRFGQRRTPAPGLSDRSCPTAKKTLPELTRTSVCCTYGRKRRSFWTGSPEVERRSARAASKGNPGGGNVCGVSRVTRPIRTANPLR